MARKKEPDRLSRAATMALATGMSYGKWMALHGEEIKEQKKKPESEGHKFICQCCGEEFIKYDTRKRKYCGDECRMRAADLRKKEDYKKKCKKAMEESKKNAS